MSNEPIITDADIVRRKVIVRKEINSTFSDIAKASGTKNSINRMKVTLLISYVKKLMAELYDSI